jgi:ribosome-associated protein
MSTKKDFLSGKDLVDAAVKQALEKKAEDIVVFNPGEQSGIAEWFVVCHGNNGIHNKAIAEEIIVGLKRQNTAPWYKEGFDEGRWILIDYSDVVINILQPDLREYYALEALWKEAPRWDISPEE